MKKLLFIMLAMALLYGCVKESDFDRNARLINELDEKYGSSLKDPPGSVEDINMLISDLTDMKVQSVPAPIDMFLDFKIKFLEAEALNLEAWKEGRSATTEFGFGCRKGSGNILNSSILRNQSAHVGYDAVDKLQELIDLYPNESKSLNVSQRDVLSLKSIYFRGEESAKIDKTRIHAFCGDKINFSELSLVGN